MEYMFVFKENDSKQVPITIVTELINYCHSKTLILLVSILSLQLPF